MKNFSTLVFALLLSFAMMAQQTGYYNGTDGISGEELKTALNDIIKGHVWWRYSFAKQTFKLSDADPLNPNNVIQVYTGFSHDNDDYGNTDLELNREHVWAKSHGNFSDTPPMSPMYSDVNNLKPSASSVNQDKSNLDFDNGGTQHDVAIGCYFTDSTWEARDEVKGDIARIIFYMSTRYEGNDGELDLEVVDRINTYPLPEHGKLSTLLDWNSFDPPDEFERNRNDVIYSFQRNRNPFIDDPNFAELIWRGALPSPIEINTIEMSPKLAAEGVPINIEANITNSESGALSATLYWGFSFESMTNEIVMTANGDVFTADIPGQAQDVTIYYKIHSTDDVNINESIAYNYYVPKIFTGTLTSIYDIQGQQEDSPYDGQVVSTSGVVTGNFGDHYYIQDGTGGWNGLFIYELGRNPLIGDSIIITGKITEYYGKTEMTTISDYYFISSNNALPEPVVVQTGQVEEQHEGILITVKNANCTDENYNSNYGMWAVNDGSGNLKIHNTVVFEYVPSEGTYYNVTGPMNYDFDEWKIDIRYASDVNTGGDTDGPSVVEVAPVISTNIKVMFNEPVEASSAEDVSNYMINNGITVESALQHAFNKAQVNLTVSTLSGDYEITIQNIKDPSGNVMELQTIPFSYVGIDELLLDGNLMVYPNPATDRLNISFDSREALNMNVSLTDITGKQILHEQYTAKQGANNLSYNLNGIGKGIYFLSLNGEQGALNYKVIIR